MSWRRVVTLVRAEVQMRTRHPIAVVVALVAPALLAVLVAAALGSVSAPKVRVGVAGPPAVVDGVRSGIEARAGSDGGVEVSSVRSATEARDAVARGKVDAALVVTQATGSGAVGTTVISGPGGSTASTIAVRVADDVAARLDVGQVVAGANGSPGDLATIGRVAVADPVLAVLVSDVAAQPLGGQLAIAVTVMMLYFVAGQASESLLADRERGVLARLAPSPVRMSEVLVAKLVVTGAMGLVAAVCSLLAIGIVFPTMGFGPGLGVVLLVVATVAAISAIGILPAGLVRTPSQAQGLTAIIAFGTALACGSLQLPDQVPSVLRSVGLATPNGWVLRGFDRLVTDGSVSAVLPSVAVLFGFAAVALAVALAVSARRWT